MPRIRFIDGGDRTSFFESIQKYDFGGPAVAQGQILQGAGVALGKGHAWFVFNTLFGSCELRKTFDAQDTWIVGLNFGPAHSIDNLQNWSRIVWLSFQDGTFPIISVGFTTAGGLEVRKGGSGFNNSGTVIGTANDVIWPVGEYSHYLEIRIKFSTDGSIAMWRDGTLFFQALHIDTTVAGHGGLPTSIVRRWESFGFTGMVNDNVYYADAGDGDPTPLGQAGPVRISTVGPRANGAQLNLVPHGAADNYLCVNETAAISGETGVATAADGDATYVAGSGKDLYKFDEPPCYGRILAVALNANGRRIAGDSVLSFVVRSRDQEFQVGNNFVLGVQYRTGQGLLFRSPFTGGYFNPLEIASVDWGVQPDAAARVSQVYLETLVTLAPGVPFDCGRKSYTL